MDIFSHIIWPLLIFGALSPVLAIQIAVFCVLPDIIWGIPAFSYFIGKWLRGEKIVRMEHGLPKPGEHIRAFYNSAHSFVTMIVFFFALSAIFGNFYFPILIGWFMHIAMDLFVHQGSFFRQMPFYPFSRLVVKGYIWQGKSKFVIINWAAIIIIYVLVYGLRIV